MDGTATAVKFAPGTTDSITGIPYFYKSECGNYTVTMPLGACKVYGAWRVVKNPKDTRRSQEPIELGHHPSAKAAKQACEDHHVANP